MDLKLFFSPIDEEVFDGIDDHLSFGRSIIAHIEKMPPIDMAEIAIIGVTEHRGSPDNPGIERAAFELRRKLYRLKRGYGSYQIVDLGNLRNGVDLDETTFRLREVCQHLLEKNVLPLIIGGSHDMDLGQYMAYQDMDKLISVLSIDAFLDTDEGKQAARSQSHIHKILLHEPNYLFNYSHLGYQSYLVDQRMVNTFEKLYFEAYRLGHFRQNFQEVEPLIRDADMLSFDVTAIRSGDAPMNKRMQPFGFTGEEACQITWYAGMNEKLSSAGFYEYDPDYDDAQGKGATVLAVMIWYFVEGFYHRKGEADFTTSDYVKYTVELPNQHLVFYKSVRSEKWWMEVPYPAEENKSVFDFELREKYRMVPCSYQDYKMANDGELPDRWISAYSKLI